jgi:hypothetical protein
MTLVCLKCASANCTCGRLAEIAAQAAIVEAVTHIRGSGDGERDEVSIELASLLLARQRSAERIGDVP